MCSHQTGSHLYDLFVSGLRYGNVPVREEQCEVVQTKQCDCCGRTGSTTIVLRRAFFDDDIHGVLMIADEGLNEEGEICFGLSGS